MHFVQPPEYFVILLFWLAPMPKCWALWLNIECPDIRFSFPVYCQLNSWWANKSKQSFAWIADTTNATRKAYSWELFICTAASHAALAILCVPEVGQWLKPGRNVQQRSGKRLQRLVEASVWAEMRHWSLDRRPETNCWKAHRIWAGGDRTESDAALFKHGVFKKTVRRLPAVTVRFVFVSCSAERHWADGVLSPVSALVTHFLLTNRHKLDSVQRWTKDSSFFWGDMW